MKGRDILPKRKRDILPKQKESPNVPIYPAGMKGREKGREF